MPSQASINKSLPAEGRPSQNGEAGRSCRDTRGASSSSSWSDQARRYVSVVSPTPALFPNANTVWPSDDHTRLYQANGAGPRSWSRTESSAAALSAVSYTTRRASRKVSLNSGAREVTAAMRSPSGDHA